jgi:hypothetical protein
MSWSGTVTCSHCYRQGHNKRKCPTLTESILNDYKLWARSAKKFISDDNPVQADYHEGRAEHYRTQYMRRTKIDPATGEKVKNKTAKAERMKNITCGYCQTTGHTRRVCEAVKADYQVYLVETRQLRENVLAKVRESGIGAGSMVAFKGHSYNSAGEWGNHMSLNYVKEYRWDTCDSHSQSLPVLYVSHKNIPRMSDPYLVQSINFTALVEKMKEQSKHEGTTASLAGSVEPPEGWVDGGKTLKEAFPTTGGKYDKERQYNYRWPCDERKEVIRSLGLEEHYNMDRS